MFWKICKIFEQWRNLSKKIYENNTSQCWKDIKTNIGQLLCQTEVKLTSHPFVSFQFINIRWSSSPAVKIFSFWSFWYTVFLKWSVTPSWNFVMTNEILVTAPSNTKAYTKHAQRKQVSWLRMHIAGISKTLPKAQWNWGNSSLTKVTAFKLHRYSVSESW